MQYRSILALVCVAAATMLGSCTTRYQDLLRDRDREIRDLNNTLSALRQENDDLQRRSAERPAPPAAAQPENAAFKPSELQQELGAEASISYRNGKLAIGVEDSVTFTSGSADLKDTAHKILKKIAGVLKRDFDSCKYFIEGHTDSDPIQKTKDKFTSNRHLSVMRADAVARYLIEQGVPENRIVVVGYGQFDPKDPRAKERNRRVEIVPVKQ